MLEGGQVRPPAASPLSFFFLLSVLWLLVSVGRRVGLDGGTCVLCAFCCVAFCFILLFAVGFSVDLLAVRPACLLYETRLLFASCVLLALILYSLWFITVVSVFAPFLYGVACVLLWVAAAVASSFRWSLRVL